MAATKLQLMFAALGDARRYQIVSILRRRPEACVSEVAEAVGISVAGVSQHMRVLEKAGLVSPRRTGQKMCYQLNTESNSARKVIKLMEEPL